MSPRHTVAHVCAACALSSTLAISGCFLWHGPREASAAVYDAGSGAPVHDAGAPPAPPRPDAGAPPDVPEPPASCDAMDARSPACDAECDGMTGVAWDGTDCTVISCLCVGADCDRLYRDLDTCAAAHTRCEPVVCRATGGTWHPELAYCGSFSCGHPAPEVCEVPGPACDCGAGMSFDPERGCTSEPRCGLVDLCLATGGVSDSCNARCNEPCPPPSPGDRSFGCRCGVGRVFDAERGCVSESSCGASDAELCAGTGGRWGGATCCPTECGRPCALACDTPACACRASEVFEPGRGCVDSPRCHERGEGEACVLDFGGTLLHCAPGLVCCPRCSGVGCREPVCSAPCCGPDCDGTTGCAGPAPGP